MMKEHYSELDAEPFRCGNEFEKTLSVDITASLKGFKPAIERSSLPSSNAISQRFKKGMNEMQEVMNLEPDFGDDPKHIPIPIKYHDFRLDLRTPH